MDILHCIDCGHEVGELDTNCPSCGALLEKKVFAKTMLYMAAASAALLACLFLWSENAKSIERETIRECWHLRGAWSGAATRSNAICMESEANFRRDHQEPSGVDPTQP